MCDNEQNSFLFHNLLINKYVIINQEKTELVALAIFNFFHLAFLFLYLMFKYFFMIFSNVRKISSNFNSQIIPLVLAKHYKI